MYVLLFESLMMNRIRISCTAEEASKLKSARSTRKSRIACQRNLMEQLTTNPKREGKFWEVRTFPHIFFGQRLMDMSNKNVCANVQSAIADVHVSLVVVRYLKRQGLQVPCRIPNIIV